MVEQAHRRFTRRELIKLSFGVLALSIQARRPGLEEHLKNAAGQGATGVAGTGGEAASLAQALEQRPMLIRGLELSSTAAGQGATLRSRDAQFSVNDSAAFCLSLCDGNTTVDEIGKALAARYPVPLDQAQADLVSFFDCLSGLGLMSLARVARLDRRFESQSAAGQWETIAV